MATARLIAIVLAAGRGERLGGRAKAALPLADGRSFVAAVTQAARAGGVARVIVVAAAPHEAATRAAAVAAGVDTIVVNDAPERGMASSFACGLAAAAADGADAALCWPVDHPLVRAETVAALAAAGGPDRIVVPTYGGRGGHPTLFGASLHAACRAAADAPDGLRSLVRADAARVVRLDGGDPGVTHDVDTLDDWARLSQNHE